MPGVEAAVHHLLKDNHGNWLFDEKLNYIGQYDSTCPMTILIKVIDDKIAELRNKTVVDIGAEFKFVTEAPYGYYKNYICMAAVALAFRRYTEKMYLADQGSIVSATIMRDIVNAAFAYWHDDKNDAKLRVRFSTAEEKELIDLIQTIFGVKGDGISETKWQLRTNFECKYKAPLWSLKYVLDKGKEFNSIVDALFTLANATGDSITQENVSSLLEGLKKQRTSIALSLEKVQDTSCLIPFIKKCLDKVEVTLDDYSNLLSYLNQTLADAVVFWREEDVEKQILQWCILQNKKKDEPQEGQTDEDEGTNDVDDTESTESESDAEETDDSEDVPEFTPIEISPISIGRTHATIDSTTELIEKKELTVDMAKDILKKLCKEYPVVCSAVSKLLKEE